MIPLQGLLSLSGLSTKGLLRGPSPIPQTRVHCLFYHLGLILAAIVTVVIVNKAQWHSTTGGLWVSRVIVLIIVITTKIMTDYIC